MALVAMLVGFVTNIGAGEAPDAVGQNIGGVGVGTGIEKAIRHVSLQSPKLQSPESTGEDQYNVFVHWIRGPLKASGNWESWAAETVDRLYVKRTLTNDVGYRLKTEYIIQPELAVEKQSLWFAVRVTTKSGYGKICLNMLRFSQTSSDPENTLRNSYSLISGSYIYSSQALGIIWGASGENGERTSHTVLNSGSAGVMVDELVFIGMQSTYYQHSTLAEYLSVETYVKSFSDFSLAGIVEVIGATNHAILATGVRTLQMTGIPLPPRLLFARKVYLDFAPLFTAPYLEIAFVAEFRRTGIIESSLSLGPTANWAQDTTVKNGDHIIRHAFETRFFRARLQ